MTGFKHRPLSVAIGAIAALGFYAQANAFVITGSNDAAQLSDQLFLNSDKVTITSSVLNFGDAGSDNGEFGPNEPVPQIVSFAVFVPEPEPVNDSGFQAGFYSNPTGVYGLPGPGIVLSTGNVLDYQAGANLFEDQTSEFGNIATQEQNNLLTPLTGQNSHFDPVQLDITFDVAAGVDTISFFAAFGSEEYPEYVNSSFTDGFGMFLNGVNLAGAQQSGAAPGDPLLPINIDHPDMAPITGTELNGVLAPNGLPIMRFDVPVVSGSTGNTFTVILADASDSALDTTIYLSSFGSFDANDGASEFTPILPDANNPTNEDGGFVFELPEVQAGETIWIDPDVAVGYTYEASGGGFFATFTAPTLFSVNDSDGYILTFDNGSGTLVSYAVSAGATFDFTSVVSGGVSSFTLSDIDSSLLIDPTNPTAFVAGMSFVAAGTFGVTQTPITVWVPDANVSEPATLAMLALGVTGLVTIRRRKQRA